MDYKYITRFSADAKEVDSSLLHFTGSNSFVNEKLGKEAKASLTELKSLMPDDFNPDNEKDLLYIASPLVLVGKCNLNGDCLDKEGAIAKYKTFKKKLLDIEHNREKIIGNIFAAALTEIDTNRVLTEEEAMQKDLFNISYAAYIWKIANPKLAQFVSMASKETSPYYNSVSSSFEVGFDDYKIAVGSTTLSQAKILSTEDAVAYEKFLKANGGKGVDDDGNPVYRVLAFDWEGRGAGLVSRPASQVKGVLTVEQMVNDAIEMEDEEEDEDEEESSQVTAKELIKIFKKLEESTNKKINEFINTMKNAPKEEVVTAKENNNLENNNIQLKNDSVITNTAKPMKITKLEDIQANKVELFKNEAFATDIAKLIEEETAKISEKYTKELRDKEDAAKFLAEAKATAEAKAKEFEAKTTELAAKLEEVTKQLNAIEEAKAAEIAARIFNERMAAFDAEFELDDEARAFIADDIKGMAEDKFEVYAKKAKALFKKKGKMGKCKEDMEKEEAEAKAALNAKETVAAATDEKQSQIPNGTVVTETLSDRMKKAFSVETVKLNGKEINAVKKE